MAYKCEVCGKKGLRGNLVSHSKRRTKHVYRPNLRWAKVMVEGVFKRIRICMDCLNRLKKENRVFKFSAPSAVIEKKAETKKAETTKLPKIKKIAKKEEIPVEEHKKEPKKAKLSKDLELAQKIIGGLEEKQPKDKKRGRPKKVKS